MGPEKVNITGFWIRYIVIMAMGSIWIWLLWQLDILSPGWRVAMTAILGFCLGAASLAQLNLVQAYREYRRRSLDGQ